MLAALFRPKAKTVKASHGGQTRVLPVTDDDDEPRGPIKSRPLTRKMTRMGTRGNMTAADRRANARARELAVDELLGAPTDIVQLGHRSAYLYEFQQTKMTGLLAGIVGFMNSDTRSDRVWIFLGPGGDTVTHVGSSFDADKAENRMPWTE